MGTKDSVKEKLRKEITQHLENILPEGILMTLLA